MTPGLCSMTPAWGPLAGPRSLKEWDCVKRGIGRRARFEPRATRSAGSGIAPGCWSSHPLCGCEKCVYVEIVGGYTVEGVGELVRSGLGAGVRYRFAFEAGSYQLCWVIASRTRGVAVVIA